MKDCKTCIWFGKEKPGQCGNYLCRNQSEYDPRTGVEEADPAADMRPVVRGEWIGNKRHQSCSECHMTYCVPDGQDGELDMTSYHFCPNCGADMREGS